MEIHAHEVLYMMQGQVYTEATLLEAINKEFGTDAKFFTCSASDLSAAELIEFFKMRGKLSYVSDDQFTVGGGSGSCGH